MAKTPDRRAGPLEEDEEIRFTPNVTPPSQDGAFNFDGASFKMRDAFGTFDPRPGTPVVVDLDEAILSVAGTLVYIADGDVLVKS